MAEDSDKNPGKIIKDQGKANKAQHQKEMAELSKQSKQVQRQNTIATINTGILNAMAKAEDLKAIGQMDLAKESIDALETLQQSLLNNSNENAVKARMSDLDNINTAMSASDDKLDKISEREERAQERAYDKQFKQRKRVDEALEKRRKAREEKGQKENLKGLESLNDRMKTNTKANELSDDFIEKAMKDLGPNFAGELDPAFGEIEAEFKKLKDLEEKGLVTQEQSNEIRQGILDAATNREKEREAQDAAELQAMALTQLGDKFARVGEKIGDFGKGAVKGAGLLGGLIALVMGVVDPELFAETVIKLTTGFTDIIAGILAFFSGDFETAKTKIGDNILLFGGVLLGLGLYFGGPLIAAFGGIFTKLAKLVKAIKVFRTFMLATFIPSMGAAFTSMMTAVGPIVAAMAPILLPIAAIMLLIGGLYLAFKKLQDSLGPGASIMDTLKVAMLYFVDFLAMIVNGITFIPRKILGFLGPRLMKWIMGDDFDTSIIDNLAKGFETDRGAKAAEEIRLKNEKAAAQKAMEEELNPETVIGIPEITTGTDLTAGSADLEAAQLAMAGGGGTQVNAPQITTQASATTNATTSINYAAPSEASLGQLQFLGRA